MHFLGRYADGVGLARLTLDRLDRSEGKRALVPNHAVRRYAERALGRVETIHDAMSDQQAVAFLGMVGVAVEEIRLRLAYYGGVGLRHGAGGVLVDNVELVLAEDAVVTVLLRRTLLERRRLALRRSSGRPAPGERDPAPSASWRTLVTDGD